MSAQALDRAAIVRFLPEAQVGTVTAAERLSGGLSGANVWSVTATRGDFVLRVTSGTASAPWAKQLRIQRLAATAAVAPPVIHVDEASQAVVSVRVRGVPLAAVGDPEQRSSALASVVTQIRALHSLEAAEMPERNPLHETRLQHSIQRTRPGFPHWAAALDPLFESLEATLATDPRRVVSHLDLNPGNIVWDGARAWFVDWDVAGLAHPFYDLAVLAMFLNMDDATAHRLLAAQEQRAVDEDARTVFEALRRTAALLCGHVFAGMVPDLEVLPATAPTLLELYGALRTGTLSLADARGRGAFAMALLKVGVG
jgi:thiamine kinase-like enzyme